MHNGLVILFAYFVPNILPQLGLFVGCPLLSKKGRNAVLLLLSAPSPFYFPGQKFLYYTAQTKREKKVLEPPPAIWGDIYT